MLRFLVEIQIDRRVDVDQLSLSLSFPDHSRLPDPLSRSSELMPSNALAYTCIHPDQASPRIELRTRSIGRR